MSITGDIEGILGRWRCREYIEVIRTVSDGAINFNVCWMIRTVFELVIDEGERIERGGCKVRIGFNHLNVSKTEMMDMIIKDISML